TGPAPWPYTTLVRAGGGSDGGDGSGIPHRVVVDEGVAEVDAAAHVDRADVVHELSVVAHVVVGDAMARRVVACDLVVDVEAAAPRSCDRVVRDRVVGAEQVHARGVAAHVVGVGEDVVDDAEIG